jgi:hypothetical protein
MSCLWYFLLDRCWRLDAKEVPLVSQMNAKKLLSVSKARAISSIRAVSKLRPDSKGRALC